MTVTRPQALALTARLDPRAPPGALEAALAGAGAAGPVMPAGDDPQAFLHGARALFAALRDLLHRGWLRAGAIARQGGGPLPCPDVPLLHRLHAAAFEEAAIAACYADRGAVLAVPGALTERAGDMVLVGRALHARSDLEFLTAILPGQWHLARAALPGQVDYAIGPVPDWARGTLAAGAPGLREVMRRDGALLLSSTGRQVQGREVLALRDALARGELRSARALFLDEAVARAQALPLTEAGVTVAFLRDDGSEAELPGRAAVRPSRSP